MPAEITMPQLSDTMTEGTVDLEVDETWDRLPRLLAKVRGTKGVEHVTLRTVAQRLGVSRSTDPETGKHDIIIDMKSDEDALPHEHEQMHRELVEKVIGKDNVGKVVIEP